MSYAIVTSSKPASQRCMIELHFDAKDTDLAKAISNDKCHNRFIGSDGNYKTMDHFLEGQTSGAAQQPTAIEILNFLGKNGFRVTFVRDKGAGCEWTLLKEEKASENGKANE